MLCRVGVKPEQMSLESFAEHGEWLCCPDIGREFIPPRRRQTREELWPVLALSYAGTSQPADVGEPSAHTGTCGLTSVWRQMGAVPLTTLKASIIVLNRMRSATGSWWKSQKRVFSSSDSLLKSKDCSRVPNIDSKSIIKSPSVWLKCDLRPSHKLQSETLSKLCETMASPNS